MQEMFEILYQQTPLVIFMGSAIYFLIKKLVKVENQKETLTQDVVKLTTLWETKATKMDFTDQKFKEDILSLLTEIKIICTKK
tara:strand:+ start:792 stop:1040 length:249 start_codon:yes stop_codon:yes gene_type:complete